jgi:hypothetical protein
MGGLVYSGKFEEHINELYSPQNISKTAKKFKEYEKKNGPYAFGKFTKFLVPKKKTGPANPDPPRGTTSGKSTQAPFPRRSATRLPKSSRPI